ncbi:hypothetical protein [Paenibacillus daejeonensis]|uniref:hypothetical protein n=1 Tax=Paenibacillus daejeonensis TaxID=135193 RepID=UPI000368248E|nr:hypothetical protein [Paenibacillus daejeonensis]
MMKVLVPAAVLLMSLGVAAYHYDPAGSHTPAVEMVAFSSLSDAQQDLVQITPKESTAEIIHVDAATRALIDPAYTSTEVMTVTFHRTATDTAGDLVVFLDLDGTTVVGQGHASS